MKRSHAFLIALAIAGALAFSHLFIYKAGKANVRTEWAAATAAANIEAFKVSERRQRVVDDAAKAAQSRTAANRAAAAGASDALGSLRNAINAKRASEQSLAACNKRADTLGDLLLESGDALQEMARAADGHASDVRLLLDAWPR